ncbi:MAG: response regulator transcription factor [Legionellaceae bacterium]|nr:response regulator transcription factor [Legionellaceae bacterium]
MTGKILLIDPDVMLTEPLGHLLIDAGFDVQSIDDGETGLKIALNQAFDAIILEIMLPNINGLELLQTLRKYKQTPVIFLTSREDDIDRLLGLQLGGDDYLNKPCDPQELLARLQAVLRRTQALPSHDRPCIQHTDITVDCGQHQASLCGERLDLTNTEFNILETLIKSPGQAFSKKELTEYALGREFTAYDRSIDVHISNLRQKLGNNPNGKPWIKTVRGFGYLFNAINPQHKD